MDIDISMFGDKELQRKLNRLAGTKGKTIVNRAMRASAKRLRPLVAAAVPVDEGTLKAAMDKAKIRALTRKSSTGVGIALPTREELGISPDDKYYYPVLIEYGFTRKGTHYPARSFLRAVVDAHTPTEHAQIGRDIGAGIEREAMK